MTACTVPIVNWLKVFAGIQFVSAITDVMKLAVVTCSTRPVAKIAYINAFYICVIVTTMVGWLIYGNTFFHTAEAE